MLAGFAGLVAPVVIHLIARHRFPVQDFPSTRLLQREERFNVFHMRLVDVPQLLVRLLLLAMAVLLLSRLFLPGASSRPAPRNLVVLVDCSASMRMKVQPPGSGESAAPMIEIAKSATRKVLAGISQPSQCALLAAGMRTELLAPLQPDPGAALAALGKIDPADASGPGLVDGIARACDLVRGRREVKSQIVVFTDMRAGTFETRKQLDLQRIRQVQDELGSALEIIFVDLSAGHAENLAVIDAYVRGGTVMIGDDAHVIAKLANYSDKPRKATVQLAAGTRGDGKPERIDVPPNGRVDVDMTIRTIRAAQMFLQVSAAPDDSMPWDNAFDVPLVISELHRVLLINGAAQAAAERGTSAIEKLGAASAPGQPAEEETVDGARILQLALNPSREIGLVGGTGIITTPITPEALPQQTLSQYDIIVLYDVSTIAEQAWQDIHAAVSDGRALLIVCSEQVNAAKFNKVIAAPHTVGQDAPAMLSPAEIGNDKPLSPPIGIDQAAAAHPVLEAFTDSLQGDLSVIRFTKLRELRRIADGAAVMIHGTGGVLLALEMPVGRGKVVLTTFGMELDRGNVARTRAFLPLTWRLVQYLTGALKPRPPDVINAGQPAVLDVSERQFMLVPELELAAAPPADNGLAQNNAKPDSAKPDSAKPDNGKPDSAKPDNGKPDNGKPDDGKPSGGKLRKRLKIADNGTVFMAGLPAGRYTLGKPSIDGAASGGYVRNIAINPSSKESRTDRLAADDVVELFGQNARLAAAGGLAGLAPRGLELAGLLVLPLVLIYTIEAIIGFILSAQREKQRTVA